MGDHGAEDAECAIRAAYEAGELRRATGLAILLYGPEIASFITARTRSADHGQEVYAMFAEDLWRSMERFGWRCSMRCWAYVLARNAANRYLGARRRGPQGNVPISQLASQLDAAVGSRPSTEPYRATENKERVRALRAQLAPEDRMLLLLFVDRQLPWSEVAHVLYEGPDLLEGPQLAREAARLRKRFERLKVELRALAIREGLLPE